MSGKSGPLNNHVQDVLKKKNQKTDKVSAMFCLSLNYYLLLFNIDRLQNSQYFLRIQVLMNSQTRALERG